MQKKVNYWKPLTFFEKCSILEVWQGSEYTSAQKYTGQKKYNILGCYTCSFDSDFHHLRFTGSQRWLQGVQRLLKSSVIYTNLPVDAIVRLPHPRSRDSQGQETFLAPSADKQTRSYDTDIYFIWLNLTTKPLTYNTLTFVLLTMIRCAYTSYILFYIKKEKNKNAILAKYSKTKIQGRFQSILSFKFRNNNFFWRCHLLRKYTNLGQLIHYIKIT